jgi:hypothetical protein
MQAVAGISVLLLIAVSAVVGIRLIRLSRRTGQRPELYVGLLIVLVAMVGYPLFVLSRAGEAIGFHAAWASFVLGSLSVDVGFLMLYLFTWKTFRPDSRWCGWFVAVVACTFALNLASLATDTWRAGSVVMDMARQPLWRQYSGILATDLGYVWAAVESFRYYAVLRRRQALGLAEPLVTNRLLLWGQMCIVTLSVLMLNNVASLRSVDVLSTPWIMAYTSLGGVAQAVYLGLVFMPPRPYREWVERRAAAGRA